ncbi:ATP-dependent DNA helicase [Geofilum rubicundum JCM 15548]|uniref:ATP-dependent DNA helicase n=1 Tax=Geofilum rubicundum JCM 15548 TaxID=1236989 RepID=A0A0E9LS15_9BACT|nr:ATP-dependent DNA helicase [Geofilum rubicundum JCM 15548]
MYGNARPENFPDVNDYRNPVVAEAMKVLGYVNRFNRGIARVKVELLDNGNPEPVFDYKRIGVFGVTVFAAHNGWDDQKSGKRQIRNTREKTREKILRLIAEDPKITINELAAKVGISAKGIEYQLQKMRKEKILFRIGPANGGFWEIQEMRLGESLE